MFSLFLEKSYKNLLQITTKPYEDIFFLPASRSGLYQAMNIFSSVLAMLSQKRHLFRGNFEIPALSVPMSDYFLHLSNIKTSGNNDVYNALAKEMEESILDAEIIFNDDSKKLEYYNKKTNLRLALSETSSMISEMAPVVAYLKYIVNEKSKKQDNENEPKRAKILFIEEPEAHLHPEVQLKLMNIFAKLIQHDIKIVMTTHSNYIFNKTNNLIYSKEMDFNKISNNHFINTEKGSIVSQAEITPTEIGMQDENFVNVSEQLYNERLSLND